MYQISPELPDKTYAKASAWCCGTMYTFTAVIFPVLTTVIMVCLWFLPTNYRIHKILVNILLPCCAWSALDVFAVSSIAAASELNEVSLWIIDQNFAAYCGTDPNNPGLIYAATGQGCFSVDGEVVIGTWISIAAIVGLYTSVIYTIIEANRCQRELEEQLKIEERLERDKGNLHTLKWTV